MPFNTDDPEDLLFGTPAYLAQLLGCSRRSAERYKTGSQPLPPLAKKLLQLHYGDLSAVLGPDWVGFHLGQDGKLYAPLFHRGLTALQLQGLFFEHQEVKYLRQEVKRLEGEVTLARDQLAARGQLAGLLRLTVERKQID